MPQLNPLPWFLTLTTGWVTLTVFVFPKVLKLTFPNEPAPKNAEEIKKLSWHWTW
uniref:ATP synthase complex subunit 8 n=2 Tax=Trichonotus TaxID=270660 RepID=A0A679EM64_9TELE|nr:ATP synthase F0 subunit 8 [Trichonotus setiger]BAX03919.1 ATPase subunit 8 [Trichonotus elegans]BBU26049.1 ATPase subunit 8 [Trichonotus elegans]